MQILDGLTYLYRRIILLCSRVHESPGIFFNQFPQFEALALSAVNGPLVAYQLGSLRPSEVLPTLGHCVVGLTYCPTHFLILVLTFISYIQI